MYLKPRNNLITPSQSKLCPQGVIKSGTYKDFLTNYILLNLKHYLYI
jgi:hypothetical protein